ncbi:MAG: glutamate--tRNA ligase [Candidatus Aenigmarchaeota archaeon]|nr:glutamate--tRNA ligase [Candidatus Aenigmarchaeota archaeon]
MNLEKIILKNVLKNALLYSGKANLKAVIGKVVSENPELKPKIKEVIERAKKIIERVNSMSPEEQKKIAEKLGIKIEKKRGEDKVELPSLPGGEEGKVIMRLAPFPSGALHIGNARMVILNDEYVKKYKGKLILFFDDTIGSEEKPVLPEAYELIEDGLRWLGVKWHETYYKSDRLEIYYKYTEEIIKMGKAYVCTCPPDVMRKNRAAGIECSCRNRSVKENLELWKRMLEGKFKEGEAVVRIKTDMKHPDPAFRDRVLLRIAEREHPRVGKKYRVWPMLEFSWGIDDYLLGITHILRGKQLAIEDRMEEYIWKVFGWKPKIHFIHYGMVSVKEAKLSKSEARKAIERGELSGWDDPRTWSLQSLRRRGIRPEAIRKFILRMGLSLADVNLPAEILYAENRKIIDPLANRYFVVLDPVKIEIENLPLEAVEVPFHPDFKERGNRKIELNKNEVYIERADFEKLRGKRIGLVYLGTIQLNEKSRFISKEMDIKLKKIQWVPENFVKVEIVMPNGKVVEGIGEPYVRNLKVDEIIQLLRIGFCRVDQNLEDKVVLYFAHK